MNYRSKANLVLTIVFISFSTTAIFRYFFPDVFLLKLAYTVTEAGLVGGIADWFAVTALFRKPLGWPYHTALIPRNRKKIIDSVALMVQNDLLNADLLRKRIIQIPFAQLVIHWVNYNNGLSRFQESVLVNFEYFRPSSLAALLEQILRSYLEKLPLLPFLKKWLENIQDHDLNILLKPILDRLQASAADVNTQTTIYNFLLEQKNTIAGNNTFNKFLIQMLEKTNALNLHEAAEILQIRLIIALKDFQNPQHPLFLLLKQQLLDILTQIEKSPHGPELENWKKNTLDQFPFEDIVLKLLKGVWANEVLLEIWDHFQNNQTLQEKFNQYVRDVLCNLLETQQDFISYTVRATLDVFSDQALNNFIMDKAGDDLQWIRINGSLVGSIAGLIVFLWLHFFYEPLLIPFIQHLH